MLGEVGRGGGRLSGSGVAEGVKTYRELNFKKINSISGDRELAAIC